MAISETNRIGYPGNKLPGYGSPSDHVSTRRVHTTMTTIEFYEKDTNNGKSSIWQ